MIDRKATEIDLISYAIVEPHVWDRFFFPRPQNCEDAAAENTFESLQIGYVCLGETFSLNSDNEFTAVFLVYIPEDIMFETTRDLHSVQECRQQDFASSINSD